MICGRVDGGTGDFIVTKAEAIEKCVKAMLRNRGAPVKRNGR
jgi:hypothetical protein